MDLAKSKFAKLLKKLTLVVESVEDDSSEENQVLIINLKEPIKEIKSSIPLPSGQPIVLRNVKQLKVAADNILAFEAGFDEEKLTYEGPMKLDVAKPRLINRNGRMEVVKAPQAWLVSTYYNRSGETLRRSTRDAASKALDTLFGNPAPEAPETAPAIVVEMAGGDEY